MATGENDLTRDVLNRAMDLYGRDQELNPNQRDLGIGDVRDIADQLGVPQRYVSEALAQPMVRPPSKHTPTAFVAERYVTHSAQEAQTASLEYLRRCQQLVPSHSVPFGHRLESTPIGDLTGFFKDEGEGLSTFRNLDFTVHPVDEITSVIRLQAEVMAKKTATITGASIGGGATAMVISIPLIIGFSDNIFVLMLAVLAPLFVGIAGALLGIYSWNLYITKTANTFTTALNQAAYVMDNPLPAPVSPGHQLAEGAGKIIGAFIRGLGGEDKSRKV